MVVNMPSEEVFTTPDHRRTEGVVRATRPLHLDGLGRVEGLTIRFERGRAMRQVDPSIKLYQASASEMYGSVREVPQTERTPF